MLSLFPSRSSSRPPTRQNARRPTRAAAATLLGALLALPLAAPAGACLSLPLEMQVGDAVASLDAERELLSEVQIMALRGRGQAAVDGLIDSLQAGGRLGSADTPPDPAATALLDRVCGQHGCASSRLFWYTDLDAARAAAAAEGKPILSLRLLGRLDEELSCANSRYFRTLYYADPEIAETLRSDFILHWRSMRPVPKVTVEFSDGRRLTRTLTGNSIHYVLDPRGRMVDGLPGLYAPAVFRRSIAELAKEARAAAELDDEAFDERRQRRTLRLARSLEDKRERKADRLGSSRDPSGLILVDLRDARTMTKAFTVNPVIDSLFPRSRPQGPWTELARLFEDDARLPPETRRRVERLQGLAGTPDSPQAQSLISTLESDLAADTALNYFFLRPIFLYGLALGEAESSGVEFDRWVYREVFADPGDEPWFGLASPTAFTALTDGGREGR